MRIRVHRGARQIGGNCVELEHDGHSILLDLGLSLDAEAPDPALLPSIPALTAKPSLEPGNRLVGPANTASRLHGVFVSHIHPDHIGLTGIISPAVPVYLGEKAARLLSAVRDFVPGQPVPPNLKTYVNRAPTRLGPFEITPFLVDHSAFDAYSFLVEAGGKRIFYSGDIRAHGRKARLMERLILDPPSDVDVLILEGTTLSRVDQDAQSEAALQEEIVQRIAGCPGVVFAAFSAQNIDRFVTFYKATLKAGRCFVGDAYLAWILRALDQTSLPRPNRANFRVYLPHAQRRRIMANQTFAMIEPVRHSRIFLDELRANPSQYVMLFRQSMTRELAMLTQFYSPLLIYSMWPGYLDRDGSELRSWCEKSRVALAICHTSGHADRKTLVSFAQALNPRYIIPIHTEVPHRFRQLFANVRPVNDGVWFDAL